MKSIAIGLMALLLVSAFSVIVSTAVRAQETAAVDPITEAEINDELSESVGAGTVFIERVKWLFTFDPVKKAELELKIARLELIRARAAAENNNVVAMERALEAHNRLLERVQARMAAIDGKVTEQGIKEAVEKAVGLERAIEIHEARIAKLKEILAYENLAPEQIEKVQARIEKAESVTSHLREVGAAKKDKFKIRWMAIAAMTEAAMTEEEAEAKIKELEEAKNLAAVKARVAEVKAVRAEKAAEVIAAVIAKIQERQNETSENVTTAIEKLTPVQASPKKLQQSAEVLVEKAKSLNE